MDQAQIAAFEAGIKLGAAYHQWIGVQLSPQNLDRIEQAIKSSLESMPYVIEAQVSIDRSKLGSRLNRFGYCELSGDMLSIRIKIKYGNWIAEAVLEEVQGYPLMRLVEISKLQL